MSPADPMRRILIVDDDPVSAEFLSLHLGNAGYEVQVAQNAREALSLLKHGARIVISDWLMPGMDGLELCKAIRARPEGGCVYFIMITVQNDRSRLLEAFNAGVDDFLAKPLLETELLARLHAGVRTVRLEDELARRVEAQELANRQLARANEHLREIAITDELTGLPNRRYALMRLQEEWARAERNGQPLSCAVFDLDHFKEVNDRHGHAVGDLVLREVVDLLRKSLRSVDVIHRMGGDEFMILFPGQSAESVAIPMERCCQAVACEKFCAPKHALHVSMTVGIACRTGQMRRPHNLLHAADTTMLEAKRAGGNRVLCHTAFEQTEAVS